MDNSTVLLSKKTTLITHSDGSKHDVTYKLYHFGDPNELLLEIDYGHTIGGHIGLTVTGKRRTVTDYDGAYQLSNNTIKALRSMGIHVPREFETEGKF